jgi:gamma-D-glutamyl-L-lysine dipeptidyl-peptidase
MKRFGYCNLSAVAVRAAASNTSEMVNQLLFGEVFEILNEQDDFLQIRGALDKYEGYLNVSQYLPISKEEFELLQAARLQFPSQPISEMEELNAGDRFFIMAGSSLRGFSDGELNIAGKRYRYSHPTRPAETPDNRSSMAETAKIFLNAPYLWGGRSLFGIDCSGLMQVVFNIHGINLQRDASYQSQSGETMNLLSEAITGDLAFFDNEDGKIIHVGMVMSNHKIIHASGMVRIDNLDHHGIYNQSLKKYTHKLRLVKRVI